MKKIIQKTASEIGIEPALVAGKEKHGLIYFLWADNSFVGAQCGKCHIVVWVNSRNNDILSEQKAKGVPDSGTDYRNYYLAKLRRFMDSLPPCPDCGNKSYDRFVNNVDYPRFTDGSEFIANSSTKIIKQNPEECLVWVYE